MTARAKTDKSTELTYGDRVRMAMKTAENPTGAPMSLREVSRRTGYSYEHVRKAYLGEPVQSREFSNALSNALGLDPEEMWQLAIRGKVGRFFERTGEVVPITAPDPELADLWLKLTPKQQRKVRSIIEGLAAETELSR